MIIFSVSFSTLTMISVVSRMEPKRISDLVLKSSKALSLSHSLLTYSGSKASRWKSNQLLVIPALWKEIDWIHHSTWPHWLTQGLSRFNGNTTRPYEVYLYQRFDPKSSAPYDWPYYSNVHRAADIFLKFIDDFYDNLPDKMLFIPDGSFVHSSQLIKEAQCVRDDIRYLRLDGQWNQNRSCTLQQDDLNKNAQLIHECASLLLTRFGFDGQAELNSTRRGIQDTSMLSSTCRTPFYVTKERIRHYTHKQWSSLYRANLESVCTNIIDRVTDRETRQKWFEHNRQYLWDTILGLDQTSLLTSKDVTKSEKCHFFRSSCSGSPCARP
jgi:hypothetical protein